jgi:hypothetical protein
VDDRTSRDGSELSGPPESYSVARPAEGVPFSIRGGRGEVRGSDSRGGVDVEIGDVLVAQDLDGGFGPCANLILAPNQARRERLGRFGSVLEDLLPLPRLPGVLAQWHPTTGSEIEIVLSWRVPASLAESEKGPVVTLADGSFATYGVQPEPDRIATRVEGDVTVVEAAVRLEAGARLVWAVGVGDTEQAARNVLGTAWRSDNETVAHGEMVELETDHLSARSGVPEIERALLWAKAMLRGPGKATLARLRDQLACGLHDTARDTLQTLAEDGDPDFGSAFADYLLWTGDDGAPHEFEAALERAVAEPTAEGRAGGWRTRAAVALEGLGYRRRATLLRQSADRESGLRLPTIERSRRADEGNYAEAAYHDWRERVDRLASGRATDSESVPADLVRLLFGAEAEAALGRLTLAPTLPGHLNAFELRNVRVGRGGVDVAYAREDLLHRYRLTPSSGGLPINLTLMPSLLGRGLKAARLGGETVQLDWSVHGPRIRPRLQLPVDGLRILELELEA